MVGDAPTFYDILEVSPDATPHEIRDAYARLKTAYSKDSLATYSLIAPDEIEGVVRQVEEAFQILSHPEKRREYDRNYHEQKRSFAFSPPPSPA
jgi:molecular chaperone DnaJ